MVAIHQGGYRGPDGKGKPKGAYEVEFYPPGVGYLHRNQLAAENDLEFAEVDLGQIREGRSQLHAKDIEAILAELALVLEKSYAPASARHELWFGSRFDRTTRLTSLVRTGSFSEDETALISSYLLDWLNGRKANAEVQPPSEGILAEIPDHERDEYVAGVLMPLAIEIIYIFDNADIEVRAREALQAGAEEATDEAVRFKEHELAVQDLTAAQEDEWWRKIYQKRQIIGSGQRVGKQMKLSKKDALGAAGKRRATMKAKDYRE